MAYQMMIHKTVWNVSMRLNVVSMVWNKCVVVSSPFAYTMVRIYQRGSDERANMQLVVYLGYSPGPSVAIHHQGTSGNTGTSGEASTHTTCKSNLIFEQVSIECPFTHMKPKIQPRRIAPRVLLSDGNPGSPRIASTDRPCRLGEGAIVWAMLSRNSKSCALKPPHSPGAVVKSPQMKKP